MGVLFGVSIQFSSGEVMKKALSSFVLAIMIPGGLFAEGLSFSGTFNSGVMVEIPEKGETDVRLETDDGFGLAAARLRLYGGLQKEAWGIEFRLQGDLNTEYQYAFQEGEQFAYAWADFFEAKMRVYAGKLAWGLWFTPFEKSWALDAQTGVRIELKPISGLSFGGTLKIPPRGMPELGKYTLERALNEAVVGARWDTRLFMVSTGFAFDGWDNYRKDEQAAVFGFAFKGIPNLAAGLESRFQNIMSGEMEYNLVERFGYPINALTYSMLRIYQDGKIGTEGVELKFNPELNMHLTGRLLPALEAEIGGNTKEFGDSFWLGIKPKLLLQLREGSNLTFYYYGRFIHGGYSAFNISFEFYF
jgi:hypothetical protein